MKAETAIPLKPDAKAERFTTISGRPINRLYTPDDLQGLDYTRDINDPGAFPYTRGIHPTGYRGKLWTMRQFAGFGTPEDTNLRYKALLAAATGLERRIRPSDSDGTRSRPRAVVRRGREVRRQRHVARRHGNAVRWNRGRRHHDVDDDQFTAAMIFAMYLVVAERQGASWEKLSGTIQNDILKEFIAQKE
jgi:methylmalonyl-CoA mutase N-terminal domain/subunit